MASKNLTDFNDLHIACGLKVVKEQILSATKQPPANDSSSDAPLQPATARQRGEGGKRKWTKLFQRTNNGNVLASISNTKLVLEHAKEFEGVIRYCNFSYRIIKCRPPPFKVSTLGEWTDSDTERLRIYLSEQYGFTPKSSDVMGAILVHAEEHAFHPVRDYLKSLEWDGVPRVKYWLNHYLGVDKNDYSSLVGTFFLVSAVARVMRAPVKVDSVLILEGLQGLGKSTLLQVLFGTWFTDTPMVLGDKDGFQQMQGMWCIELAELDSFNKAENTRAKQFFGSRTDRYRPSYGRLVQEFPRQCVFVGTTNQDQYLKDSTGNRRYWPVSCSNINQKTLESDRDMLWAEALFLFNEGFPWWPDDKYKHLFESQQDDRFESDVWESVIFDWLRRTRREDYSCAEIMQDALDMDPQAMRPPEQKRVGQIMTRLGFSKKRRRVKGNRPSYYVPPEGFFDAR